MTALDGSAEQAYQDKSSTRSFDESKKVESEWKKRTVMRIVNDARVARTDYDAADNFARNKNTTFVRLLDGRDKGNLTNDEKQLLNRIQETVKAKITARAAGAKGAALRMRLGAQEEMPATATQMSRVKKVQKLVNDSRVRSSDYHVARQIASKHHTTLTRLCDEKRTQENELIIGEIRKQVQDRLNLRKNLDPGEPLEFQEPNVGDGVGG